MRERATNTTKNLQRRELDLGVSVVNVISKEGEDGKGSAGRRFGQIAVNSAAGGPQPKIVASGKVYMSETDKGGF